MCRSTGSCVPWPASWPTSTWPHPPISRAPRSPTRSPGSAWREPSATVERILSLDGRVRGVALSSGEEIEAPAVASGADPKRTLLQLVDPGDLGPTLRWRAANIRLPGVVAKVDMALSGLPAFDGADEA